MKTTDLYHAFTRFSPEEQELLQSMHRWYTVFFQPLSLFFQTEFRALVYLVEHGECTPSQLVAPLGVTRQRVTTLLTGLREKGYVTMEMDESDRRKMRVRLTEAGLDYFVSQSTALRPAYQYTRDKLGETGLRQLIDLLNKLSEEEGNKNEKQ